MTDRSSHGLLTFLSDFGLVDSYVAEVKGAILSVDAGITVVDVTHDIPRHDIRHAAFVLFRNVSAFPDGTVHLAVVDPGVGSGRRPVLLQTGGHLLVGPDNGLLSWAVRALDGPAHWRMIDRPDLYRKQLGVSFHGRDLFGPVAAGLASGQLEPDDCGPLIEDPVVLPWPEPSFRPDSASGEVIAKDRFGNLIVGIPALELSKFLDDGETVTVLVEDERFDAVWGPYGAGPGLVAHQDSSGLTEIAARGDSATQRLNIGPGARLELKWGR